MLDALLVSPKDYEYEFYWIDASLIGKDSSARERADVLGFLQAGLERQYNQVAGNSLDPYFEL